MARLGRGFPVATSIHRAGPIVGPFVPPPPPPMFPAYTNRPDFGFQIALNADPNDPAAVPVWVDFTRYVRTMSGIERGQQYELGVSLAAAPQVGLRDLDENLNSANPGGAFAGLVKPYRRVLFQGMWPNGGTGNLLNPGTWTGNNVAKPDPSFELTAVGATPGFITAIGGTAPVIGTTTPHTGSQDLTYTVAGTTTVQGVSWAVACMPGRQYTATAWVRQSSASTQGIYVDATAGSTTTTTGAYVRLTVTFTATQPSHVIAVKTSGTAVGGTVLIDDVQHEPGGTASTFTTSGPVIYPIMANLAERFTKQYADGGFTGYVSVPCVDAFAALSGTLIGPDYDTTLLTLAPDYYYPLTGDGPWVSLGTNPSAPLAVPVVAKSGPGLGITTNAAIAIPGASGSGGVHIPLSTGDVEPLTCVGANRFQGGAPMPGATTMIIPASLTLPWSVTVAVWAQMDVGATGGMVLELQGGAYGQYEIFRLEQDAGNPLRLFYNAFFGGGGSLTGLTGPRSIADGNAHLIVGTITQDAVNTTWTLWIDNVSTTGSVSNASIGGPSLNAATSMIVGAQYTPNYPLGTGSGGSLSGPLSGTASRVAIWNRALSVPEVTLLWNAGQGFAGETSGARIARHLALGGYTGPTRISTGTATMQPATYGAQIDLLSDSQNTTQAELGRFWIAPDGYVVFEGRTDRFLRLTPSLTLGQNVGAGNVVYLESVEFDTDPQNVFANVQVSRNGGSIATGGLAADIAATVKVYFNRGYSLGTDLADDEQTQNTANWIFYTHNAALQRVSGIILDPASNPSLWPVALSAEIGQRWTVAMKAPAANAGAGITFLADYFVEQVIHDGIDADAGTWQTSLQLSPIGIGTPQAAQPWVLEHPTWGQLGITTRLAP